MKYQMAENCWTIGKNIKKPEKEISFLSYLITGNANILIDTLPDRCESMLKEEITSIIGEEPLTAIILNHSEEDHSGALPGILQQYPGTPVYCSAACRRRLAEKLPEADFRTVKTGEIITFGSNQFTFYETPGLHWDDNMVTFWNTDGVLFSNDLFGQYAAAEPPTGRNYSAERLLAAAEGYYEKVFSPAALSEKRVILSLAELSIRRIAPGHGLILEDEVSSILQLYRDKIG
jgi:flavorubredoxin